MRETDRTRSWSVNRRGWVISDLARSIATDEAVVVLALDFPFSIPECLLQDVLFAAKVSAEVFATRSNWAKFVQSSINLEFDSTSASAKLRVDPNLTNWRDKVFWRKRATDVATRGQPPLKDKFQNLFNMTLIGAALLGALSEGGMQITLHPGEASYWLKRSVIETYPGAVARAIGSRAITRKLRRSVWREGNNTSKIVESNSSSTPRFGNSVWIIGPLETIPTPRTHSCV